MRRIRAASWQRSFDLIQLPARASTRVWTAPYRPSIMSGIHPGAAKTADSARTLLGTNFRLDLDLVHFCSLFAPRLLSRTHATLGGQSSYYITKEKGMGG